MLDSVSLEGFIFNITTILVRRLYKNQKYRNDTYILLIIWKNMVKQFYSSLFRLIRLNSFWGLHNLYGGIPTF